jgi:glycosyltransferase involved in cell wall biosynthesis
MNNPFFSVAIPTYGYDGKGSDFLNFSLSKLSSQTFKDFEVVISDHSSDDTIKEVFERW